ncbi:MAG: zf-HC2 domain-containing protein [Anaerolineae bacterium]|nr:zf-HC2 domain-containing protein [Anaerolineae bacterium]
MTSRKLTCQEAVELVTDYLEAALLPEIESKFNQHLDACPDCNIYVAQMRCTLQTLRRLVDKTISTEEQGELLQLFQAWQKQGILGQPGVVQKSGTLD